jgi:hypothetical protein
MFEFFSVIADFFGSIADSFNEMSGTISFLQTMPEKAIKTIESVAIFFPDYLWGFVISICGLLSFMTVIKLLNYLPLW